MRRDLLITLHLAVAGVLAAVVLAGVALVDGALRQADGGLDGVEGALTAVHGHADPLAFQIESVNGSLERMRRSLAPLDGQASELAATLGGIRDGLRDAGGDLAGIDGHFARSFEGARRIDTDFATAARDLGSIVGGTTSLGALVAHTVAAFEPLARDFSAIAMRLADAERHMWSGCEKTRNAPGGAGRGCA